jgi:Fe-S-cluster-containing dehydrogenase component
MSKNCSLIIDLDRCLYHRSCEVACQQENNLPLGIKWMRVVVAGPEEIDGKLKMTFPHIRCRHCGKPPCMDACPTKAIKKRNDGIVVIDSELCIGCKECIEACPFGVPQFDPEREVVSMCNLCMHRLDQGLLPACVEHCPTQAIKFGDINDLTLEKQRTRELINLRNLADTEE